MKSSQDLRNKLKEIDRQSYKAYKSVRGCYRFDGYALSIDHVQGDPFAAPSRLSVHLPPETAQLTKESISTKTRRIAAADFLTRSFADALRQIPRRTRGSGKSGRISIDCGRQEVLERTSVLIDGGGRVECRFMAGLPAKGRRILGHQAIAMIFEEIPEIVNTSLRCGSLDARRFREHIEVVEDQESLRSQLSKRDLVAFVANGATLPRRSGVDDSPSKPGKDNVVVPFESPPELEVEFEQPNDGRIRGMGIPVGVTLIVGGGFHGKSTLLRAIERGVYNHIPGDGRERVVSLSSAVKIRAEDGRSIESVDISSFISNLPYGRDTIRFSTENASGSTSQAANIIEALEMGTDLLLIDEDTSATNFIIRDARMQALIDREKEPITPFIDRVVQVSKELGVSTIMVMGGSGDYFDVADEIIAMEEYRPRAVTGEAKALLKEFPSRREKERGSPFGQPSPRCPDPSSFDPSRGKRAIQIDAKGLRTILFGADPIDLTALEQLVDRSQTRAIGEAMLTYARRYASKGLPLRTGLRKLEEDLDREGLDLLQPFNTGRLARPRIFEVAFAINRLRTIRVLDRR